MHTSPLLLILMISREYNDGPDVTYISCERGGLANGAGYASSQVVARYSLVDGSEELRREFRCCRMLDSLAIGENSVLTSIGMLNAPRRRNKEPVLFSHLFAAARRANWSAAMRPFHLPYAWECAKYNAWGKEKNMHHEYWYFPNGNFLQSFKVIT